MILVTAANGNQGKHLIPRLVAAGAEVRACVRSEESAQVLRAAGVADVLVGDLADPAVLTRAVRGSDSVYYVGPALHPDERAMGFAAIDAAREAGVTHFVFSSVLHAIITDLIQHEIKRDLEEYLISSGLEFTVLQPTNYMLRHRLVPAFQDAVFRLSWALDRFQSMVDVGDVAEVAAADDLRSVRAAGVPCRARPDGVAMPRPIDATLFRETLGHYPTGVAVVTTMADDGTPDGMVVGTFSSVSLDPPLIAFFPAVNSRSFARLRTAPVFCVNVLASDQEPLCRQIATNWEGKFDGVGWRPGPLGTPIIEGAVSWIECTFEDVREAGDHFVVLGRVHDLAVERSTLPLLFFQGGYGRFSPGSFVAAPDPELIQAAHLAETIRAQVEELSTEFAVNCSVLARIRDDAVQVLAANRGAEIDLPPLGHRQPIIPPMGAVFMVGAAPAEVDEWLQRAPDDSRESRALYGALLDKVRERGYSLLAAEPELLERHRAVLSEFEQSDRLPRQERAVQQVTAELAELFGPDLVPGRRYDLASIVVLIPATFGLPPIALRMTGLPGSASAKQVESWIDGLKRVANAAATAGHRGRPA